VSASAPPTTTGVTSSTLADWEYTPKQKPSTYHKNNMMAYFASSNIQNWMSKGQYYVRRYNQPLMIAGAVVVFFILLSATSTTPSSFADNMSMTGVLRGSNPTFFGGARRPGYFLPQDAVLQKNTKFAFAAVTDLDELSKIEDERKPTFRSYLLSGTLVNTGTTTKTQPAYQIEFGTQHELRTKHNEGGRGAEFSELTLYQNRLYTFDDRTGDVFEILNQINPKENDAIQPIVVPRFTITEGEGETDKGMKWEWATVKNNELYMGSIGKPFTDSKTGEFINANFLYVSILNNRGELRREYWGHQYDVVAKALGVKAPGYIVIEAMLWSDHLRKWVFLPRRISYETYNDILDEKKGSNKLIMVDEKFQKATVVDIQMESMDPLKGFSTFAFVPGTQDRHAIAVRSVEEGCADDNGDCKQRSYCLVFDVMTGEVLSPEVQFPGEYKFEGIEFVNMDTQPPLQ
jgi:soluble calcium-activated nucleotidase 1